MAVELGQRHVVVARPRPPARQSSCRLATIGKRARGSEHNRPQRGQRQGASSAIFWASHRLIPKIK
eukprot:12923334-Prorocentrum_lima.AAC.1